MAAYYIFGVALCQKYYVLSIDLFASLLLISLESLQCCVSLITFIDESQVCYNLLVYIFSWIVNHCMLR